MTYYPDLSTYRYGGREEPSLLNVGWLESDEYFPQGAVGNAIARELRRRVATEAVNVYRGFHQCSLCGATEFACPPLVRPALSCAEIHVPSVVRAGYTYAAPLMIVHYVEAHGYLPPGEFLASLVQASPRPGARLDRVIEYGRRFADPRWWRAALRRLLER